MIGCIGGSFQRPDTIFAAILSRIVCYDLLFSSPTSDLMSGGRSPHHD